MQRDFPVPVQRQKGIRVSGGKGPGCTPLRVLHSPHDTGIQPTDIMPGQLRLLRLPVVPSMWQKTIVTLHHKDSSDWQNHFYVCRKSNKSNMRKKRKYKKYVSLCHFIHCEEMFRNSQEGWYGAIHVVKGRNACDRALRQWDGFDFLPEFACDTAGSKAQRKKDQALMKRNLNCGPESPWWCNASWVPRGIQDWSKRARDQLLEATAWGREVAHLSAKLLPPLPHPQLALGPTG